MEKLTEKEIAELKAKHGDIFLIELETGEICYLKKPNRTILSAAMVKGKDDVFKYNEIILQNCWIMGDETIKTDIGLFLGVSAKLGEVVEVVTAEIKKL